VGNGPEANKRIERGLNELDKRGSVTVEGRAVMINKK
jgi:hypothetical protein